MKWTRVTTLVSLGVSLATARQSSDSDEGGRILVLEKAWNQALEEKDTKALDMILASTMVSVDVDRSVSSKTEFLASIKSPDYQPSQAVTEQTTVQVYGAAAVVFGILRVKGTEKGSLMCAASDLWIPGSKPTAPGSVSQPRAPSSPRNNPQTEN